MNFNRKHPTTNRPAQSPTTTETMPYPFGQGFRPLSPTTTETNISPPPTRPPQHQPSPYGRGFQPPSPTTTETMPYPFGQGFMQLPPRPLRQEQQPTTRGDSNLPKQILQPQYQQDHPDPQSYNRQISQERLIQHLQPQPSPLQPFQYLRQPSQERLIQQPQLRPQLPPQYRQYPPHQYLLQPSRERAFPNMPLSESNTLNKDQVEKRELGKATNLANNINEETGANVRVDMSILNQEPPRYPVTRLNRDNIQPKEQPTAPYPVAQRNPVAVSNYVLHNESKGSEEFNMQREQRNRNQPKVFESILSAKSFGNASGEYPGNETMATKQKYKHKKTNKKHKTKSKKKLY